MNAIIRPNGTDDATAALLRAVNDFPIGAEVQAKIPDGTATGREIRGNVSGNYDATGTPGPNQNRVSFLVWTLDNRDDVTGRVRVWADDAVRTDGPVDRPGTTKVVTVAVTARFHGTYFDADEVSGALAQWIHGGLDDRDDLRGWTITPVSVTEFPSGDPDD